MDHLGAKLVRIPEDTSERERKLVMALAISRAKVGILTAHVQRYEHARERGVVPEENDLLIGNEVHVAIEAAEKSTALDAPGYEVSIGRIA